MGYTHIKIGQGPFLKRLIRILDSIRIPISMLARMESLALSEINLVSCLTHLLAQFGKHLGQVKTLRSSQKEVPYLVYMPNN